MCTLLLAESSGEGLGNNQAQGCFWALFRPGKHCCFHMCTPGLAEEGFLICKS